MSRILRTHANRTAPGLLAPVAILLLSLLAPPPVSLAGQDGRGEGDKPRVYMPYAASRDHMVVGIEIPGYHMRYDLAQGNGMFMILLPDGYDSLKGTPAYFAIDTLSLDGGSLQDLFENDLEGILRGEPGTKIVRRELGAKLTRAGTCLGAELAYPPDRRAFPRERFFICRSRSKRYAILLSVGARTRKDLEEHYPRFLEWAEAPQMVTDHTIAD